ncbi:MAG: glycoside hydrolase family 130 protein [Deltaproteobacteria bacterium]|nr:glycoside hydrolase family 130 protein [Deltaproteobacteria bacterium]
MLKYPHNPIITPGMITPSAAGLEVKGALNPGVTIFENEIVLLLRVAEAGICDSGAVRVPRYAFNDNNTKGTLDVLSFNRNDAALTLKDNRAVIYKGKEYVSTLSHLRLARSTDGIHFNIDTHPFRVPGHPSEEYGVEDARITKIDNEYYINYTAVSKDSYGTALIKTTDFQTVRYLGMPFCVPNKDVCIFPERINGKYYALHRPYNHDFGKSSIWIASSYDLIHWGDHQCLIRPGANEWEEEKIGGGAPPIKTSKGWLEIYHGKSIKNGADYYSLLMLLLDLDDPRRVVYRGEVPVLHPSEPYETHGFVPNVVFLNGMVLRNASELLLYYSACDETTCLATCALDELLRLAP